MIGLWGAFIISMICGISVFIFADWFDKKMENDENE